MKNIVIKTALMLIVGIFSVMNANAQQYRKESVRHYEGYGMFNTKVQNETNPDAIQANFRTAIFGSMDEALAIYRHDLKNVSPEKLMALTVDNIAHQLGRVFDPNNSSLYHVEYVTLIKGTENYDRFWGQNKDGYVKNMIGTRIYFADQKSTADAENEQCMLAVITEIGKSGSAILKARCGNATSGDGFRGMDFHTADLTPPSTYANVSFDEPRSVVYQKPTIQWDRDVFKPAPRHSNTVVIVAGVALVSGGVAALLSSGHKTPDNSYNNGFQGGSGSSGASGGSGGQHTTYAQPTPLTLNRSMVNPKISFMFTKIFYFK